MEGALRVEECGSGCFEAQEAQEVVIIRDERVKIKETRVSFRTSHACGPPFGARHEIAVAVGKIERAMCK